MQNVQQSQNGFSLLEVLVVLIVGGILIVGTATTLNSYRRIQERQNNLMFVERQLNGIQLSFSQYLTTIPGREIGFYSGKNFSVPQLPNNGTINNQPISLGLVTPYKVGGFDAISIVYATRDTHRMELAENSQIINGAGLARVALPNATVSSLHAGSLMLLSGYLPITSRLSNTLPIQAVSRLVKLTTTPKTIFGGTPSRSLVEFQFDLCDAQCSSDFPQLVNATNIKTFSVASTLMPLNLTSYYVAQDGNIKRLMRNVGGSIVPGINGFELLGGTSFPVGEIDNLAISYELDDSSIKSTPNTPIIPWLNQIKAVNISVTKSAKSPFGNEKIEKTVTSSYAIATKNLE